MSDYPKDEIRELPSSAGAASGRLVPDVENLLALLNAMPGGAAFIDPRLVYRYANRQFLTFFSRPEKDLLDRHASDVYSPDHYETFRSMAERALAGETVRLEGPSLLRGGDTFVRQSFTPYRNPEGDILGIIILGFDLTAQMQQERRIAEQLRHQADTDALNQAIVENALDCIIIIDEQSRIVGFNPAAEQTFGVNRQAVLGKDIADIIIPEVHRDSHRKGMARYLASGDSRVIGKRLKLEALRMDGTSMPAELAIGEVRIGERRLFTAHIRDLSAEVAQAREIERQRETLYQKEKLAALGSLLSGVAHELNNPLSIVIGQAMMLKERTAAPVLDAASVADLAERGAKIEQAANRCARIVKSFLAMARQRQAERRPVDLKKLVSEAIELLAYGLRTSGVTVTIDLPDDLPLVHADADQIHQVLVNLVINARQALEEHSGQREVRISARRGSGTDRVRITVSDNGPGIPASIRNRIFDPFFTTKPQDHGTGIGLAVSRGLIEAHGGTLELSDPQPAHGAAFDICLPLSSDATIAGGEAEARPAESAPAPERTVLVVDDEPDLAELIAEIARSLGFRTRIASSGQKAQDVLTTDPSITAILCDIRMPDGDGPSLYDWLSAKRPDLVRRIGFVTGDTLGPSAGRFLAQTGCPVIEKPFGPSDIRAVLNTLVSVG